ncbi:hypothetical protein EMIT0P100_50055 [Pseudomonas sp. IT-P100]
MVRPCVPPLGFDGLDFGMDMEYMRLCLFVRYSLTIDVQQPTCKVAHYVSATERASGRMRCMP